MPDTAIAILERMDTFKPQRGDARPGYRWKRARSFGRSASSAMLPG